jgi:hypothetical protein
LSPKAAQFMRGAPQTASFAGGSVINDKLHLIFQNIDLLPALTENLPSTGGGRFLTAK